MSCYKTNDLATMTAWTLYQTSVAALREEAKAFASRWGADANYVSQANASSGFRIYGFTFTPPKARVLWTVPDHKAMGVQRPRTKITKATPEQRAEHKQLLADWDVSFPKRVIPFVPVLQSMGLTWGDFIFSGYRLFEHGGYLWLKTEAKPKAGHMAEILGSEFEAAREAFDQAQKET